MTRKMKTAQGGSVLLEAMISILIFSFGVLGIIGLQSTMISSAADAKYRSEAGFFADRLLGEMAAADRASLATLATFQSPGGVAFIAWYNNIQNTVVANGLLGLPGAGVAANQPIVNIQGVNPNITGLPTSYDVTVSIFWQSPTDLTRHQHIVQASLSAD